MHKAGFVNIVGNPNVGKSTLMNLLVGERISIATFKSQTTRHRIMGILNTDDMQIVFSDTPGVVKPNYKLQESMLNFSESALVDADFQETEEFKIYSKQRYKIEAKNSELKHRHGYGVASSRGLFGMTLQGAFTIFAVNMKRILALTDK